jgi:predicted transcriptional regulator of viral defense system
VTAYEYTQYLLSVEEYAFSWEELLANCGKGKIALTRELSRLEAKKQVINLRKGFYVIIPPRYARQARLPVQLYIHKLFRYLDRPYYLGFYSAAKFHGAGHQQIQSDYVMTVTPPMRAIQKNGMVVRFFTTTNWPLHNLSTKKSDAGYFNISSPALTVTDLIHYQTKLGGLNRQLTIINELAEEITQKDMVKLLSWYLHKSTLQRMGYLLEMLEVKESIITPLRKHLEKAKTYPVLLRPKGGQKPGAVNNPWKVDVNLELDL